MPPTDHAAGSYSVAVDHGSLKGKALGPAQGTRYTVALTGQLDDRWVRSFLLIQMDETGFFRFRLDVAGRIATVSFTARSTDGPDQVIGVIERLDVLIQLVNQSASLWTTTG